MNEQKLENIKFSTTHILGSNLSEEILINRVSGSLIITGSGKDPISAQCKLLDAKKF